VDEKKGRRWSLELAERAQSAVIQQKTAVLAIVAGLTVMPGLEFLHRSSDLQRSLSAKTTTAQVSFGGASPWQRKRQILEKQEHKRSRRMLLAHSFPVLPRKDRSCVHLPVPLRMIVVVLAAQCHGARPLRPSKPSLLPLTPQQSIENRKLSIYNGPTREVH